ncbi:MAG: hypothetical protein LBB49_06050, partial [Gracilibacteraceae bacterium]|nr:hypothetical protein [Gracilibacteraceae bacterium]
MSLGNIPPEIAEVDSPVVLTRSLLSRVKKHFFLEPLQSVIPKKRQLALFAASFLIVFLGL